MHAFASKARTMEGAVAERCVDVVEVRAKVPPRAGARERARARAREGKGAPTRRCSAYRPARLRSPPNRELRSLRGRRRAHGTHGSPERAAPHTSSAPPPIRSQALRTRRTAPDHGEAKPRTDIGGGRPAVKSKIAMATKSEGKQDDRDAHGLFPAGRVGAPFSIAMATKSEGKQDDRDVPGAFSRWAGGGTPLSLLPLSPSLGPRRYRRCCGGTWPYPWGACACCACCAWGGAGV